MQVFLNVVTMVSAILMVVLILAQSRGVGLGEAFGGDSTFFATRRGIDLVMYQLTILFGVVFILSIILGLMSA